MNKHLPQLDGLRGLAILIVLLGHLIVFDFGLGIYKLGPLPPIGVDLFFVLSGFLITRILLQAKRQPRYFQNFYARRALRIWPLYYAALLIFFGITNHRVAGLTFDGRQVHWLAFAFYLQNLWYPKLALLVPPALASTWSLSVEEQFYAIWPLLVRALSTRALVGTLCFTIVLAAAARVFAPKLGVDPYVNPLCRFDAMAIGGLVAIWTLTCHPSRNRVLQVTWLVLGSASVAAVICHFSGLTRYLGKTLVSAALAMFLLVILYPGIATRAMANPVLRFFGKISYCLYLSHLAVAALVSGLFPGGSLEVRLFRIALIVSGSIGIATLSWYCFEAPILRLKRYFPARLSTTQKDSTNVPSSPLALRAAAE